MHGIETELEQATEKPAESRPNHAVQDLAPPARDQQSQTFSPDPMQQTDRYRLVTPYQLSRED
jgi:hypothetical protein